MRVQCNCWSQRSHRLATASRFIRALVCAAVAGALGAQLAACGYTVAQTRAPYGAHRIHVEPFSESLPVGVSADVTGEFARLLAADGVELCALPDSSEARLVGTIAREATTPSPTLAGAEIAAYRVVLGVDAALVDKKGKTLWSGGVTVAEDFATPGSDSPVAGSPAGPLGVESNRRRALLRASERAARLLHERLVLAGAF